MSSSRWTAPTPRRGWPRSGRCGGVFVNCSTAERELYASLPVDMPDVLPGPAAHGSVVVAGVQSADRLDQAILRRHRQILNLSVLLGAGPGREWSGLRERVETIIGPLGACHLGAVTLELGKAPAQTPGDADVLELERGDEDAARRVLRLLGRTGADGQLGAWAWSDGGGHPEMPHFVRHLMHMTAIRHQHRTYRWLMEARATGTTKPLARMRTPDGGADRELPSTAEIRLHPGRRWTAAGTTPSRRWRVRASTAGRGGGGPAVHLVVPPAGWTISSPT
jgi:hypothetical protein